MEPWSKHATERLFFKHSGRFRALAREILLYGDPRTLKDCTNENTLGKELTRFHTLFSNRIQKQGRHGFRYALRQDDFLQLGCILQLAAMTQNELCSFTAILRLMRGAQYPLSEIDRLLPEKMGCMTERATLRRHLNELVAEGVLLRHKAGRQDVYGAPADVLADFTLVELSALRDALRFGCMTTYFCAPLHTAHQLLNHRIRAVNGGKDLLENDKIDYDRHMLHPLLDEPDVWVALEAIQAKQALTLSYLPANSREPIPCVVWPVKIRFDLVYGRSYLYAVELSTNQENVYRFDRMRAIAPHPTASPPCQETITRLLQRCESAWTVGLGDAPVHVRLSFLNRGDVLYRLSNEKRMGKISQHQDGRLIFTCLVNDWRELKPWVLSFGAACKVLAPRQLRDEVIACWKGVLSYG